MEHTKIIINPGRWSNAYVYTLKYSFYIASFTILVLVIISYKEVFHFKFIPRFMVSYAYWVFIIEAITLSCTTIIGVPTVFILNRLNLTNPIYAGIIGSLSILLYLLVVSKGQVNWFFIIFVCCGYICGYAFMHGYKKGGQS